jgi:hypothetical protein
MKEGPPFGATAGDMHHKVYPSERPLPINPRDLPLISVTPQSPSGQEEWNILGKEYVLLFSFSKH